MRILERESEGEQSILFIQHEHFLTDAKSTIKSVFDKLNINPGLMPAELFMELQGQNPEMYKTVCSDDELKIIANECSNWIGLANEAMKTGVWHA